MSLIALIILAAVMGWAEALKKLDIAWVQTIKWVVTLSAFFWLGGITAVLAVFLIFQSVYIPVRNKYEGKDIWFIDKESWLGELVSKYLGDVGGRVVYISQFILAVLILLV